MQSSAGTSRYFANSLRRVLLILATSIGLLGISLPGFSQSPAPGDRDTTTSTAKARPARSHRVRTGVVEQPQGPKIWLRDTAKLGVSFSGSKNSAANGVTNLSADDVARSNDSASLLAAGQAQPLSMVKGDFDQDGYEDVVISYATPTGGALAFYRGNREAFAPQSDVSFAAIGRGDFPAPFLPQATVIAVPVAPKFIATGNFAGNGFQDLVMAANGGRSLYLLPGDGKGNFGAPQEIPISGNVTSLASGEFGHGGPKLFVATSDPANGFGVSVFGETNGALAKQRSYSMNGVVSDIQFGDFGDTGMDAAFLSSGQLQVLRSSTMQIESVSLPVDAVAFALGSFLFDRNGGNQVALLSADGSVRIAARNEFDPRAFSAQEFSAIRQARFRHEQPALIPARSFAGNGWKIVESFPPIGSVNADATPLFFRARISINGADDLMWLNATSGQMAVLSHPDSQPGASTFAPGQISTLPYSGTPTQALPMRVNVDGRPGILALHLNETAPFVAMPIPDPTFFVNRTDDPTPTSPIANACNNTSFADNSSSCSIREAVLKANGDTIMLPAGTFTLTRPKVAGDYSGQTGALYVNANVTIVGAGQGSTIIQAGTLGQTSGTPNGVDMVMAVNEDIAPITNATASLSNLTLQNGHNRGTIGNDGDGGCMEYDTGSSGNANLFLTNVTMNDCSTTQGDGAGLVIFNFTAPANGLATISNSIFQHNSALVPAANGAGSGGGIWVSDPARMVMTSSQVINNLATQINGASRGEAGGIFIFSPVSGRQTLIHSSVISGNSASGSGGGIWAAADVVIDQGTIISGNTAGNDGSSNNVGGGGIYYNSSGTDVLALSKVTITGNSATGNGGAIAIGNDSGGPTMTMVFSRLAGNSSTFNPATANVWNDDSTLTATNNWWGTNTPATTIFNTHNGAGPAPVTTFDPFIVLTHTASPSTVLANATTTLTASFLKDNHGTAIAAGNLDVLTGVAPSTPLTITFGNAVLGAISAVNGTGSNTTGTIQSNGTATATFTAGGVGGTGHADATVDNGTATATITIPLPPVIIKAFGAASIPLNATTSLTFTIQNNNAGQTLSGVGFTDTFPAGLVVSTPNGLTGSCGGGTITATAGTNVVSLTGATLTSSTSCTFAVNVTGSTAGAKNNTTGNVTSTEGGTGGTASASVNVEAPPSIAKVFVPSAIALNATSSLTFTITNPAANASALTGVAFTDTLPTGLTVASAAATVCGGTLTTTAPTGIALTGATIAVNSQCLVSVTVTGAVSGQFTNTTGAVTSTNGGTGNTATANLTVGTPPTITKSFGAASIPLNGSTSLSFTITNPAANTIPLTGIAFTDTLPSGLVVATPNGLTTTCSGTATATAGSGVVALVGSTLTPNSSCTVSANVTGTTGGVKNNSVQVTATESGPGNVSNASITVVVPPVIIKAFGAASIPLNASTSLTFTIQNNNAGQTLSGVGFTDTFPAGLVVSTPNGLTGSCGGGTITATAGTNVVSLTGATLTSSTSCTFAVNVTGSTAGTKNNTTGNVTSVEGGTGGTASASVNVEAPPSIAKVFVPSAIALNATSSLTFTITNPAANASALTGVAFTDTLPTGLTVASAAATVCGGTLTTTAPTGIALTGATVAVNSQCLVSVTVTGAVSGQFTNTTGTVTSTNGGTGNTATANLTVGAPPTITKSFGAASIPLNGGTSLTFTVTNPNTTISLTGVAFTDILPAGTIVAVPNALVNTCGGAATAVAGSGQVSLTAGTLASTASCTVSVNVQGTTGGVKNNSVQVTSTEGGTGNTSNASITVIAPPVIIKAFGAVSIPLNASTSLTFTIQNNNATSALSGVGFTDSFPTGLVISTPNGLTGSCGGGVITATQATGTVTLTGATLASSTSCTFAVNVTGSTAGSKNNTTGNVTSVEGGTGGTASASLGVVTAPVIAKAFAPSTVSVNSNSVLTFTITNPAANSVALTGVALTDTFPAGLVVSTPNALVSNCGGVVTATAGSGAVSLTGGTVATNASCAISLNATSATRGVFNNTTGAVSSTNGGTGNTASASLTVIAPDLTVTKSHSGNFLLGQIGAAYSLTVNNIGTDATVGTVTVVDTLPAGLAATAISGTGWSCTLATLTCTRADALATGASYPVITLTVNVTAAVTGTVTNNVAVSGGGEANLANDTAADVTTISTFTFTTTNATMTVRAGQTATYNLTITPVGGAVTIPITVAGITTAPKTSLNLPATPVTPGANPAPITLTATTTPGLGFVSDRAKPGSAPFAAILFPMGLVVLTGLGATKYKKNKKFSGWIALILVISFFGLGVMGCVGTQANFENLGTPPGTYAITATATVAGTQQTLNLTLIVQP